MNGLHCCQAKSCAGRDGRPRGSWLHRVREVAGIVVPSTVLALLPKCPVCIAAYVALGTGIAMTPASAHILMRALTALGVCTLAFCMVRRTMNYFLQKHPFNLQSTSAH